MSENQLLERTKRFAVNTIKFVETLPKTKSGEVLGKQLLRSGTSVFANYRSARQGRSPQEFASKMGIVQEETDESMAWFELIRETIKVDEDQIELLYNEAKEIFAMVTASIKTIKKNYPKS